MKGKWVMIIDAKTWQDAIEWAKSNEGTIVEQINEEGKVIYTLSRNKIKCENRFEQLIYRFKLNQILPDDTYYLSIHTRTHKSGTVAKTYLFTIKHKATFKNKPIRTEKARLADAILQGYIYDQQYEDLI